MYNARIAPRNLYLLICKPVKQVSKCNKIAFYGILRYIGSCPSRGTTDSLLGVAAHEGLILYWELPLMRGYWFSIGSFPHKGQLPWQHVGFHGNEHISIPLQNETALKNISLAPKCGIIRETIFGCHGNVLISLVTASSGFCFGLLSNHCHGNQTLVFFLLLGSKGPHFCQISWKCFPLVTFPLYYIWWYAITNATWFISIILIPKPITNANCLPFSVD